MDGFQIEVMESDAVYVSQAEVFADLLPESPQALIVNGRTGKL
jgi:hypothetical protein